MDRIGKLTKVIHHNEKDGFTVGFFRADGEEFKVVGSFERPKAKLSYRITGHEEISRYGPQFRVDSYEEILPEETDELREFLASGVVKGIGQKLADAIVDRFGKSTLEVIENSPEKLLSIKGIGKKILEQITGSFQESKEFREYAVALRKYDIGVNKAIQMFHEFGSDSLTAITENPYELIPLAGYSFKRADDIALRDGLEENDEFRIRNGIIYAMHYAISYGNTYAPKETLIQQVQGLLSIGQEEINDCMHQMFFDGSLVADTISDEQAVYLPEDYNLENFVSSKLAQLKAAEVRKLPTDIDNRIENAEQLYSIPVHFSEEQRSAIRLALTSNVSIITGGPGTGKTTIINAIVQIFQSLDMKICVAAPTGRAAKRIQETSGFSASTIHRLLECVYDVDTKAMVFNRNDYNPLEEVAVIIDESSMVDLNLMGHLLRAVNPGTRIIFVGDANQLPSVGPGNVLRDMIHSEFIPVIFLHEIFRQGMESQITGNASLIRQGECPECVNREDGDFFFIRRNREDDILEQIESLFEGRLQNKYDFVESNQDIQVLTPMKKTMLGTEELNRVLHDRINPPSAEKAEDTIYGKLFREGDRVMQTRNNYQLTNPLREGFAAVFNGDTGRVVKVRHNSPDPSEVHVQYEDNLIIYYGDQAMELEHAYAITVHKSQGSEFPVVVIPIWKFSQSLMTRDLIYTGITRGKKLVILIGNPGYLKAMVDNDQSNQRHTGLEFRLRQIDFGIDYEELSFNPEKFVLE